MAAGSRSCIAKVTSTPVRIRTFAQALSEVLRAVKPEQQQLVERRVLDRRRELHDQRKSLLPEDKAAQETVTAETERVGEWKIFWAKVPC